MRPIPHRAANLRSKRKQVVSHLDLPKLGSVPRGSSVVEIVFQGSIGATLNQKLHHRHMPALSGYVECGNSLTVR